MEIDPEKLESRNMRGDLNTIKNDHEREGAVESINENETNSALAPSSENLDQTRKPSLTGPTKLLSDAWRLYKSRWKTFLGIIVVPILLMFVIFAIFAVGALIIGILGPLVSESAVGNVIIFAILLLVLSISMIIIQFWSQAALIYAIKDSAENIGIKESYRRGWHKIRSFFWVSILSSFIIMGGYMFFIIPGIIFSVWFSLALYVVITEDLKGMNALLKSREYIRNYWWQVFWRFFVMGLFIYLIIIIFVIFVFLIATLCGITADIDSDSFETIINLPINIISLILTPLFVIYPFLIYNNLKRIKGDFEFKPSKKSKRSFIIIGLIGFLIIPLFLFASVVLISLNSARDKAMDATRHSDMSRIKIDLLIYYDDKEEYPKSLSELDISYIDPETDKLYEYRQLDNGNAYKVCALFEEGRECFSSENNFYENSNRYDDIIDDIEKETLIDDIKMRDLQRTSDSRLIFAMLENCRTEIGNYPLSPTISKLNKDNSIVSVIEFTNDNISVPLDPKDPEYYYGYRSLDGESFELTARLENINDSRCDLEIKENIGICIYKLRN